MENLSKWSDEAAGPLLESPRMFHQAEARSVMNYMLNEMESNPGHQISLVSKTQMGF